MKLSLFTPTHRPDHLDEVYESILRQSYKHWEWVLAPNGPRAHVPEHIRNDPRVRITTAAEGMENVGAMKRAACLACTGDAFVEMDHDDYLMPGTALAAIAKQLHDGAGFVYSDAALFNYPSLSATNFSHVHGWDHYPIDLYGRTYNAAKNFEVSPRSLCEVYYAPDHVRVWERDTYFRAGGHNAKLSVADDHQLVIRSYLSGAKFGHTGGCHYLYRLHEQNTVKERQQKIHELTARNRMLYGEDLIREWGSRDGRVVVDVREMLRDGWKFERDLQHGFGAKDTVSVIWCHNVLQLCPPHLVVPFFNLAYEALVPGGYLSIVVPDADGAAGHLDPRYVSQFNKSSFHLYTRRTYANRNPDVRCRFQLMQVFDFVEDDFQKLHDLRYARVQLVALKGQRQPGQTHI